VRRPLARFATLATVTTLAALIAAQVPSAMAVSPSPCPSPTPSTSSARTSCPSIDPIQALYDQLRARLGGDLARALTSQQQLSAALNQSTASQLVLTTQIAGEEARIADLQNQIAQLEAQIADTQSRIDVERAQVASIARAMYRQPDSLLVLIARSGNLHDALVAAADLVVAGQRAHAVQARLEADLATLQADRDARNSDLDRENGVLAQLTTSLTALNDAISLQTDISGQLDALMGLIRDAEANLTNLPPDVTANLARLLEQQEQILIERAYQAAWNQAQVGAGLAIVMGTMPVGASLPGLLLSWPIAGGRVTQPFGPSSFLLEPPLGRYPHFHTGVDVAGPFGTAVTAAADGVVVAVNHTPVGYGNYVIVAHGAGIMTLYAHLLQTDVNVGDRVYRGERIGLEGSSGLSTGPHLHFELRVNGQVTNPMPYLPPLIGSTTPNL
jgi:murein DD-endopeptidase MepM/ murein hydrolase activator NlpD